MASFIDLKHSLYDIVVNCRKFVTVPGKVTLEKRLPMLSILELVVQTWYVSELCLYMFFFLVIFFFL